MKKDISVDIHLKCTGSVGSSGGVGFWQFVVKTHDNASMALTGHTVCRYGSLYNVKPACPWNACSNGDCSECKTDWIA